MRAGWYVLVAFALWCAASASALAEKRVALIIGNSGYQHAVRLANPANDADAIGKMFTDMGFDVVEVRRDLLALELRRAVREFSLHTRDADVAIVFYAGHAFEMNGTNYLVPTDAMLERDFDVEDETVPLDRFLASIESARRLRLVILDACRDNPFVKKMRRSIATRAIGQGLAKIDVTSTDTLIAFAAKAGSVATDGEGPHSPFTAALLKHLPTPGLDVRIMFGRVRDDVFTSTARRQEPFVYGSLGGSDVTLAPAPAAPAVTGDPRSDYQAAEGVGTLAAWDLFLARHGTGFFANLAREQRAKLLQAGEKPAGGDTARKREEERKQAAARKAEADAEKKRAEEERQRVEREKAQRERAQQEEAARRERERIAGEKEERERAEREKAQREEVARLEREKAGREEAARIEREQAEREQARREEAARAEEEQRRLARERAEREKGGTQLAMLPPTAEPPAARARPPMSRNDLVLAIKRQLRRIGCYPGKIDESWGDPALTRSITQFVKQARFSGATNEPTYDFLDALSASGPGVCALECGKREVARNGRCVPKACPPGQAIGGDGECIAVAPGARR
jgi:uncharacterized caspase-like protein